MTALYRLGRSLMVLIGGLLIAVPSSASAQEGAMPLRRAGAMLTAVTQVLNSMPVYRTVETAMMVFGTTGESTGARDLSPNDVLAGATNADMMPISLATSDTGEAVIGAVGLILIMSVVGMIILVLAERKLKAIARTAASDISHSFWAGVLFQLFAVPGLIMVVAACAITLVGIFAIPFVIIAWGLLVAGIVTLGFLGVAYLVGRALSPRSGSEATRAIELKALMTGLALLGALWIIAAALVAIPFLGVLARLVTLAFTWAATTIGVGAVVRARAEFYPRQRRKSKEDQLPLWQTPTPVMGVVAAVRIDSAEQLHDD